MAREKNTGGLDNQNPGEELFEVTLLKDHEHGGEKLKAGTSISVNKADRDWLQANFVIPRD